MLSLNQFDAGRAGGNDDVSILNDPSPSLGIEGLYGCHLDPKALLDLFRDGISA